MARRKGLSPEDDALWRKVTTSVTPLKKHGLPDIPNSSVHAAPPAGLSFAERRMERAIERLVKDGPARIGTDASTSPVRFQADRGLERRIKRGLAPIEARIDLHGMTQDEAYRVLVSRLTYAAAEGKRCVLIITGKGVFGRNFEDEGHDPLSGGRGVLRRQFHRWTSTPPLSGLIIGVREAHAKHGGSGAFYTFLKRNK